MSSEPVDDSTPNASLNISEVPPPGLSPRSALRAVQERNLRVENENVFLQEQLTIIKTLMENDKEARERDRVEMAKHRAAMEQERASLELLRTQLESQKTYKEAGPWMLMQAATKCRPTFHFRCIFRTLTRSHGNTHQRPTLVDLCQTPDQQGTNPLAPC